MVWDTILSASGSQDQSLLDHFRRRSSSVATSVQLELGTVHRHRGKTGTLVEAADTTLSEDGDTSMLRT
jgi:hypothetical protein